MDAREAAEALKAVTAVEHRLAARAHWPWARHAAFGAVLGALVASYALPLPLNMGVVALCCAAVGGIVAWDRRRDGFFVNGYRAGRTRRVTVFVLGAALIALAAGILGREFGWGWAPLAAGAILFVVATLASMAWERIYRAELEGRG